MVEDFGRNVVVTLLLVAHVDKPMVDPHLEFCRRSKLSSLILVELLETLKS
jgi:hypothetical protein